MTEDKYVFGIDPGTTESGYAIVNNLYQIIDADKVDNDWLLNKLKVEISLKTLSCVVIESIQSYGSAFGKSTIETCYFIGRLIQVCEERKMEYKLIPRPEYGKAIIGSNKVNDALIRSALENRFGSYDKGKSEKKLKSGIVKQEAIPNGPLYKLSGASDKRSAYALACYYKDVYGVKNV